VLKIKICVFYEILHWRKIYAISCITFCFGLLLNPIHSSTTLGSSYAQPSNRATDAFKLSNDYIVRRKGEQCDIG
jgi:hypothetical protein